MTTWPAIWLADDEPGLCSDGDSDGEQEEGEGGGEGGAGGSGGASGSRGRPSPSVQGGRGRRRSLEPPPPEPGQRLSQQRTWWAAPQLWDGMEVLGLRFRDQERERRFLSWHASAMRNVSGGLVGWGMGRTLGQPVALQTSWLGWE